MKFSEFLNEAYVLPEVPWDEGGEYHGDINISKWTPRITSLKRMPKIVHGSFYCSNNGISSLKYGPVEVSGNFDCSFNNLKSLKNAPTMFEEGPGYFKCSNNRLTSLVGAPTKIRGDFFCEHNHLTTLKGAPKIVHGDFHCTDNSLVDIDGLPNVIAGNLFLARNTTLTTFPALRFLKVKMLRAVFLDKRLLEKIIIKYLNLPSNNDNIMACQNELIDAGLEAYAYL